MSSKFPYHYSEKTESFGACHAQSIQTCPLRPEGSEPIGENHFKNKADAIAYQEKRLTAKNNAFMKLSKKANKEKLVKKYFGQGTLSPAKLGADGAVLRPAVSYESYYEATNKKHFASSDADMKEFYSRSGSQFSPDKVNSIEDLAVITSNSRADGLKGNDIDKLVALGADRDAFGDGFRYLVTPVGGRLGSMTSHGLDDDTVLDFHEKVPGSNIVSLTIEKESKPEVDFGVLIIKDNADGSSVVATAHPGLPSASNPKRASMTREEKDAYDEEEHNMYKKLKAANALTVGNVRKWKGNRDFNINVKQA